MPVTLTISHKLMTQFLTATTPNALFTHDDPKTISTDTLLAMPDIDK